MTSLTVIIGSRHDEGDEQGCLEALAPQVEGVEVLLVRDVDSGLPVPDWVRVTSGGGGLIPELWAAGLRDASGDVVALTASTSVPGAGWVRATMDLDARGHVAVGGPIEPGVAMRPADWAVYFCRYASYALPVLAGDQLEVAADNASYRRRVLEEHGDLYRSAFLEPFVHRALRADGHAVTVVEDRVVTLAGGNRLPRFLRQRFQHGRQHGRQRSIGASRRALLIGIATAPAVPAVMTVRTARTIFAKRRLRGRFLLTVPLVVVCYCAWAAGEAAGRFDSIRGRGARTT